MKLRLEFDQLSQKLVVTSHRLSQLFKSSEQLAISFENWRGQSSNRIEQFKIKLAESSESMAILNDSIVVVSERRDTIVDLFQPLEMSFHST